ncbi:proteasome subunit alpha [Quadrisphaera sp. DSM 44207]|uniref:proteasome subunit alpha n=1 Tax=Quadrisphaera sp. DSM 44207 TaxID=1881057 RepID=UPI00088D9CDE|nr:proteasome subunit alpha [Quadrisphaera sp. DSM 44207]SDQ40387.1 proteasome alpha subunit [Quadrisphaera sp. DSM 44207]
MSMPFYVSPEQLIRDKADYARKGIARGRSVVVTEYEGGIAFIAENPSRTLHKISEIYDRIAFAAAGKYNEFENLRVAGVRYADLRGYSYDRADVTARGLANAYAQTLGTSFTTESKPLEVELVVAEVGPTPGTDQIYRLTYDGSVSDERGVVVMGGQAEQVAPELRSRWQPGLDLAGALRLALVGLAPDAAGGAPRQLGPEALEVAVLERDRSRRSFRRVPAAALSQLLGTPVTSPADGDGHPPGGGSGTPGGHSGLPDDVPPHTP